MRCNDCKMEIKSAAERDISFAFHGMVLCEGCRKKREQEEWDSLLKWVDDRSKKGDLSEEDNRDDR